MTIISLLIILFAGVLYLMLNISDIQEKKKQATILRLNLPVIIEDLEQVIEMTSTVSKVKLLFDTRYVKYLNSSQSQDSHLVRFPIMVGKKLGDEDMNYLSQVFLAQFSKYLADSATYGTWSDKGQMLIVRPQFGKWLRHNNQYYLNLEIQFSYNSK